LARKSEGIGLIVRAIS